MAESLIKLEDGNDETNLLRHDRSSTIEIDDDKLNEMTASYSEISFDSNCDQNESSNMLAEILSSFETKRPDTLHLEKNSQDLHLDGTVTKDGEMVSFIAEDLETKIKLSSPGSKKDTPSFSGSRSSTPSLYRQALMPQIPNIDPNVLNDIELEARRIATSVDNLTENLAGILHSVSALTVDCLETYRDAVCKTCDAVDSNIKSMYQLMAKCEELSKSMKNLYKLSDQIKEIKRLLDLLENVSNG